MHRRRKTKFNWYKKINIFRIFSILLIIFFIFLIPAIIEKLIKINKIECETQYSKCDEVMTNRLQIAGNYRDVKKIIEQRLKEDVRINNYLIQYKIPSTLKIELSLKRARYCIKNLSNDYYFIDKEGIVIEKSNSSNLSCLANDVSYINGQKISNKDIFALMMIEKVSLINSIESSIFENNELKIVTKENKLIRFPSEGDLDVLVGSLNLIFSRLNENQNGIRMEDVHEIDLRFKNIILK